MKTLRMDEFCKPFSALKPANPRETTIRFVLLSEVDPTELLLSATEVHLDENSFTVYLRRPHAKDIDDASST